ncbi:hypothetical protein DSL64_21565 [Dyadobacter luteus]|uniref:Ricin B lectin domain-containing protein n=1 Tax=Dyadobacter luteus TaxID=2259619 RepID=A0A3D8Y6I6_9BACT|nr:RICIN domain-containing protein [Dyadobacter luteus]REA58199.1 hypothetical protein DSL64_21565 [Dyadobacter luteus]
MSKGVLMAIASVAIAGCIARLTIFSSTKHMKDIYAIQNVKTGKGLRPYNAYPWNGNKIVLHDSNDWKCMTWRFIASGENTYQLQNLSTKKTFEASSQARSGINLWQQPLSSKDSQQWIFENQPDQSFLIRQKGTDLYLTISDQETDTDIIIMPFQNSETQLWRLVEQHPWR